MAFKKTPSKIRHYFFLIIGYINIWPTYAIFLRIVISMVFNFKECQQPLIAAPLQNSLEHLGYCEGMISDTLCAQYQQKMEWFEGPTLVDLAYGRKQAIWLDDAFPPLKQILFCLIRCVSFLKLSKYDLKLLQNMNLSLKIPVIWSWMKLNLL